MQEASDVPGYMRAVLLKGHGGTDQLEYREDVPVPLPAAGEVLIRIRAAALNNTDINTRIGWYSKSVTAGTGSAGMADSQAPGGRARLSASRGYRALTPAVMWRRSGRA
jgi:hypothetical protein